MLSLPKHLYCFVERYPNSVAEMLRKLSMTFFLVFLLLGLGIQNVQAQRFDFAASEAVWMPKAAIAQICHYIEVEEGHPMTIGGKYAYVPVFNVLNRSQKLFTDGIYVFVRSAHSTGELFVNYKGKVIILESSSVVSVLHAYSSFLKLHRLPETTQLSYLSAIADYMQYRYKDQQELIKAGAQLELK